MKYTFKFNVYYISIIFFLAILSSCEDDCLNKEPLIFFTFSNDSSFVDDGQISVKEFRSGRDLEFGENQSLSFDLSRNETGFLLNNNNQIDTLIFSYQRMPNNVRGEYCIRFENESIEYTSLNVLFFNKPCLSCDYEIEIAY